MIECSQEMTVTVLFFVTFVKTFRLTLKPSLVEKTTWCHAQFRNILKPKFYVCCMCDSRELFECLLGTCGLLTYVQDWTQVLLNIWVFWDDHVVIPRVRVSFFPTDEGLRVSQNILPKYTSQWQKTALLSTSRFILK